MSAASKNHPTTKAELSARHDLLTTGDALCVFATVHVATLLIAYHAARSNSTIFLQQYRNVLWGLVSAQGVAPVPRNA